MNFSSLILTSLLLVDFFPKPQLPKELQTLCNADRATFDPKKRKVHFENFSGSLPFQHGGAPSKLILFSDQADLDKLHRSFFLYNDVHVHHHPHFTLHTDRMRVSMLDDQRFFLHGEGRVTLSLLEKSGSKVFGEEISWNSNQEKIAVYGAPLHLEDPTCDLYCKKAFLHYKKEDNAFQPGEIRLQGEIQLYYHEEDITSYGIAETIRFDPKTKELILEGERVLFCNSEDTLRISAPTIIIRKGEYVKGKGDVHFSFSEEEKRKFNQQFSKFLHLR